LRTYRIEVQQPELVRPVARLTTRPAQEVMMKVTLRT